MRAWDLPKVNTIKEAEVSGWDGKTGERAQGQTSKRPTTGGAGGRDDYQPPRKRKTASDERGTESQVWS